MFKHGPRLRETYAGKPVDELVNRCAVFKVLKQRSD